jgi:S-adenosyl-L-methionine hydrolase (adenosine-forming)
MTAPVVLLTDFGLTDAYVGVLKGVLARIAPDVPVIDLCHGIPPGDVLAGALQLEAALPFFPPLSVFCCVVDPGVGTSRRAIAMRVEGPLFLVGPDNGLLSLALAGQPDASVVELANTTFHLPNPSATFHGRDIFAPVAGHLASGVPLGTLGPAIRDPVRLELPEPRDVLGGSEAAVLYLDHFGNAVTAFRARHLEGRCGGSASCRGVIFPLRRTFGDASPGAPVALIGSTGRLELAVARGHAAATYGIQKGDTVFLSAPDTR